jgi:hypothetical protein
VHWCWNAAACFPGAILARSTVLTVVGIRVQLIGSPPGCVFESMETVVTFTA